MIGDYDGVMASCQYSLTAINFVKLDLHINTVKPALKTTCIYRPPAYKDHLLIKTAFTGPQGYTFHVIEPAYKDHLSIRTTFCWSLGLSLYTRFTVYSYT